MKPEDRYLKFVQWNSADRMYVGYCPDLFPWGGVCHGTIEESVYRKLRRLVREEVVELKSQRKPLPAPTTRPMRENRRGLTDATSRLATNITAMRSKVFISLLAVISVCAAANVDQQRAAAQTGQFTPDKGYFGDLTLLANDPKVGPRAAFLKLIDRPRVDLAPQFKELGVEEGLKRAKFSFATEANQRVPGLWYQRADASGRLPVVIILHGTGGSKEGMKEHLIRYARAGFAAVAIDGRYHGERTSTGKGKDEYVDALLRAWRNPGREYPFFYDTVWDVMRLIDFLETRSDVDPKRIGAIGFSKGGIETYLAAAVEPRIAAAVPCIGVQNWDWALRNDAWQSRVGTIQAAVDTAAKESGVEKVDAAFVRKFYARVVPGIDSSFDGRQMVPLVAPRPLFIINGDSDPRTPQEGVQPIIAVTVERYNATNARDRFEYLAQKDTGHKVTPEAHALALEWFKRWLKPQTAAR